MYKKLKMMFPYNLFVNKEEYETLKNSQKIIIENQEVSIKILKKILSNDLYFEYALKTFQYKINFFRVSYDIDDKDEDIMTISYNKTIIIKALEQLISSGQITLQSIEQQRYETLTNYISFSKMLEEYKDKKYHITIDEYDYSLPIEQLISFMQLSNEQFDTICSNIDIKDINGIPKEHFIYAAYKFFKENKLIENFLIPNPIIERFRLIASCEKIDLQAINKHLTTPDTLYQNIQIDSNLEKAILSGMPENATDLEKAIYIYIKMCKLLTYDEEYFVVNQRGIATAKHRSLDYVSSITLTNNKAVCFEFNIIYAKLLNQLGIHFKSNYNGMIDEAYGESHVNLEFRADKFLVTADSVTVILQGDMTYAKLNQPLVGLKCINHNQQTQQEFKEAVTKMYQLIAEQDKSTENHQQVEHIKTLDELLKEYSHTTDNIKNISLEERLTILIDIVNSTKLVGTDALSYILQLKKILFTDEQRKNNIAITIVRNNKPIEEGKTAIANTIFTLNNQSFKETPQKNIYYYFNNHKLTTISKEELQALFNNGIFEYIEKDSPRIPGIIENGGKKK